MSIVVGWPEALYLLVYLGVFLFGLMGIAR